MLRTQIHHEYESLIERHYDYAKELAELLSNINFESEIICELNIREFYQKLTELVNVPEINTFYAIVITSFGELKKIDLSENPDYIVCTSPQSKYHRILEKEKSIRKNYKFSLLLYPPLARFSFQYAFEKDQIKEMNEEFDSYFSDIGIYEDAYRGTNHFLDEIKKSLDTPYLEKIIPAWCQTQRLLDELAGDEFECFNKSRDPLIFGVRKRIGTPNNFHELRGVNYYQISDEFESLVIELSCQNSWQFSEVNEEKRWLSDKQCDLFLTQFFANFSPSFETCIKDRVDEDYLDCVETIIEAIQHFDYCPEKLSIQERTDLHNANLFKIIRFMDKQFKYVSKS